MEAIDLLVRKGLVVTMNPGLEVIPEGSVAVAGDSIVAVGTWKELDARFAPCRTVEAEGCAVTPGFVNGHTHAAMTLFRGLADDLPLMAWLEGYIFPVEAHLRAEWVRWGARLACAEMLLGGTTTFCDMYLFEEEVARAAKEAGIRAMVGEVLYDFPSPNYGPWEAGLRYTEDLIDRWRGDPLVQIAVEPHAVFTCSPQLLRRARETADRWGVPLAIHLSETRDEVERVQAQYGVTPVRHLERLGVLDGPTIAHHVVWVDEQDMAILRQRRVGVIHNPESNMKLASGVAPVPRMLQLGMAVGLGTDGCASNNNLDLLREMDTAAKLQKVFGGDPTVMDAATVLRMATSLGAEALGLGGLVGSLEPGKKADMVLVDLRRPHLTPLYNIFSHMVYAARAADVRTVLVGGEVVVEDGVLRSLSLPRAVEAVRGISREIRGLVAGTPVTGES
jgi:5-methylthioadenosine/S-adenosylhomocysteine deaminase